MNSAAQNHVHATRSDQELILELKGVVAKKSEVIEEQKRRIQILEEYLRLAKQKQFGRSSEKCEGQGEIFNEAELTACDAETEEPPEQPLPIEQEKAPQKKPGRKGFAATLPREQVHIHLSDEEKIGAIDTFYTKVKEELDITPAQVRVIEYMQEKAVFLEQDERTLKAAVMPKHPLGKAMASVQLLAYIIIAKYMDGLPLYRLETILQRYGGDISRASMAHWIITLATQCQPLIHLIRAHQHSGPLIQADETVIQVHNEAGYSNTGDKYMWVTLGGPPGQPSVLFEYAPSRKGEVALRLLDGYQGYVQTDGYSGYDEACRQPGITQLGCMDHARRKFAEAQKAQPKGQQQTSKADVALNKIAKLYAIEREIKELTHDEKKQRRQQHAIPILNDLRQWLDRHKDKTPRESLTGKAMTYLDNQWPKLIRYCEDGRLSISNIQAENAIRPFVIGRKNWLFADTPKGARASAHFYSLIETAKANGIDPYDYLRYLFKELPYADSVEKLEALLPWNMIGRVTSFEKK